MISMMLRLVFSPWRGVTPVIPNDVEEDNHDIAIAHMGNDTYFGIPIPEIPSDQYSSSDSIHIIVHPDYQISEHNRKWAKDHPLENIIGELDRAISTRLFNSYSYLSRLFSVTGRCFPYCSLHPRFKDVL
ncbi:hypothetical protein Tco_0965127 [Tanacetum coccineum]